MNAITPPDLDRKLSKKIDQHKTIQLSPAELDLLVISGAYDTFRAFVADYQRDQCQARDRQNRSTSGGPTASSSDQTERTSTSSGTTSEPDATAAAARARQMWPKRPKPLIGSTSSA